MDARRGGPFVLTGSQNILLSQAVTQSLAGRAAVLELLPFSLAEPARRDALVPEDYESSLKDAILPPRRPVGPGAGVTKIARGSHEPRLRDTQPDKDDDPLALGCVKFR